MVKRENEAKRRNEKREEGEKTWKIKPRSSWGQPPVPALAAVGSAVGLGGISGASRTKMGPARAALHSADLSAAGGVRGSRHCMASELALGRKTGSASWARIRRCRRNSAGSAGRRAVAVPDHELLCGARRLLHPVYVAEHGGAVVQPVGHLRCAAGRRATFGAMLDNPFGCAVFTALFLFICMMIVKGGVSEGIEKFNKIGMPALFVMLVIVIIRSLTLPNAVEGLKYMFVPGYAVEAGFIEEAPSVISRAGHGGRPDVLLAVARDGRDGDLRLVSEQEGKHREKLRRHRHRRHDRRADGGPRGHSGGGRQRDFERYPRQ